MAGYDYAVSPETLAAYAKDIMGAAEELSSIANQYNAKTQGMVNNGTWTGSAASAYANVSAEFKKEADKLIAEVRETGQGMGSSSTYFTDAEQQNVSKINNLLS